MPNILALLKDEGTDPLEQETRGGITQPVSEVDLVYSDTEGDGEGEFVLRNISPSETALQVQVTTVQAPYEPDAGTFLDEQWAYENPDTKTLSTYANLITIPEIGPGKYMRIRRRVVANIDSSTATHYGDFKINYKRSSA